MNRQIGRIKSMYAKEIERYETQQNLSISEAIKSSFLRSFLLMIAYFKI